MVSRRTTPGKSAPPPTSSPDHEAADGGWLHEFGRRRGDAEYCIGRAIEALVQMGIVTSYADAAQLVMSHLDKYVRRTFLNDDGEEDDE